MVHKDDAVFKSGMRYVVECMDGGWHSPILSYSHALYFQKTGEMTGHEMVIRTWSES